MVVELVQRLELTTTILQLLLVKCCLYFARQIIANKCTSLVFFNNQVQFSLSNLLLIEYQ